MKVTVQCSRIKCFGNRAYRCRVLQEPIYKAECPFFQTDEQVREGRAKAIERLHKLGRDDLIQQYTQNAKGYAL